MADMQFPTLGSWNTWSELDELQQRQLGATWARARRSPFYRERLAHAAHGDVAWQDVPFTTKLDLRDAYPFRMLAIPRNQVATYHESSGTSGEPTASFLTDADWAEIVDRFGRSAARVSADDTVLVKTPYAMATTAHQMHRMARARGAMIVPADNRTTMTPYSRVIRLLRDLDVTVTWSLPFETLVWAAAARLAGHDPRSSFPALRAIMVAGEPLTAARQRAIEVTWNRRVYQDYGSTETCSLAGQCPEGALHFWADRFLAEVITAEREPTQPAGTGELVVTNLYAEAMPVIRYRMGDWVTIDRTACACGWTLPIIRIHGRASDALEIQGRRMHASEIEEAIYIGADYQVLFWRARHDHARLDIECEATSDDVADQIQMAIQHRLGIHAEITVRPPGSLIPHPLLTEPTRFAKPRFVYNRSEPWPTSLY
jgi:phenylacetate-CoA ligase